MTTPSSPWLRRSAAELALSILVVVAVHGRGFAQSATPDDRRRTSSDAPGVATERGDSNGREPSSTRATRFFQSLDLDHDGIVTEAEALDVARKRFHEALEAGDQNGDSGLTLVEFQRATITLDAKRGPPSPADDRRPPPPAELFRIFDQNGDGKLYLYEVPEGHRKNLQDLFTGIGGGIDRPLTLADFERWSARVRDCGGADERPDTEVPGESRGGRGERASPRPECVSQSLDRDGNGRLSPAEVPPGYRSHLTELLARLGRRPDESLSLEEFEVAESRTASHERTDPRPSAASPDSVAQQPSSGAAAGGTQAQGGEVTLADLFRVADRNHDGFVDRAEGSVSPRAMRSWLWSVFERSGKDLLTLTDFTSPDNLPPSAGEAPARGAGAR